MFKRSKTVFVFALALLLVPALLASLALSSCSRGGRPSGTDPQNTGNNGSQETAPTEGLDTNPGDDTAKPKTLKAEVKCDEKESEDAKNTVLGILKVRGYRSVATVNGAYAHVVYTNYKTDSVKSVRDCTSSYVAANSDIRLYRLESGLFLLYIDGNLYQLDNFFYVTEMCLWDYDSNGIADVVFLGGAGSGLPYEVLRVFDVAAKESLNIKTVMTLTDPAFKAGFDGENVFIDGKRVLWNNNRFEIEGDDNPLHKGLYTASGDLNNVGLPYVTIFANRFTVVENVAVSYQPAGDVEINGDEVILKGTYGDADFRYVFKITSGYTISFDAEKSVIAVGENASLWSDGLTLTLASPVRARDIFGSVDVENMTPDQAELMKRCPEYFGLNASKGLIVVVWQMAPGSYSFGLIEDSGILLPGDDVTVAYSGADISSHDLLRMRLKGVNAAEMRAILETYPVSANNVIILPWQNPVSNYIPECWLNSGGEDMNAKMEAYINAVRSMLF